MPKLSKTFKIEEMISSLVNMPDLTMKRVKLLRELMPTGIIEI
jgi:hypothetical protein